MLKSAPVTTALLPLKTLGLGFEIKNKTIINGVDLTIKSSGISVILGPNGAGKSVLLRLIHGLLTPTSGSVTWGGAANTQEVRKRQALVFQSPIMMRRSVAENIKFVLSLRKRADQQAQLEKALELSGLTRQAHQPARLLSGGEQQRLAIARALALDPEVLILDEPSSNLDPSATLAIEQIIQSANETGKKVILVTHDLGQAKRLGDEIIFMHHGEIVEQASGDVFFPTPSTQAARAYLEGKLLL